MGIVSETAGSDTGSPRARENIDGLSVIGGGDCGLQMHAGRVVWGSAA